MKRIFGFLIILTIISCKNNNNSKEQVNHIIGITKSLQSTEKKKLKDFATDSEHFLWIAEHSDTSRYWIAITFHEEYAIYWFHGQCQYYYFTNLVNDTISVLWSYKTDCILNMNFLEKSNGVKSFPKRGDLFATYSLKNDSVIYVKYYYPDWIKRVNEIEEDSIFPTNFYYKK